VKNINWEVGNNDINEPITCRRKKTLQPIVTMTKKENLSKVGNNSLLQTARTKTFGAGKFALHALQTKSKPKPPVKKIKIPIRLPSTNVGGRSEIPGEGSKVSDITSSVGEESPLKRPGVVKEVRNGGKPDDKDIEIESSVMEMSINSGNSFPLSPLGTNKNETGDAMTNKQKVAHQSTAFSYLWPKPAAGVNRSPNNLRSKNLAKSPKPIKSGVTVPKKKTMDISRGVRFSAPAPMTLNRCQLQMGQEKTAPESKEYLEMQAQNEREQQQKLEAEHIAEAKRFVEERLKEEFEWEEEGLGFEAQLNELNIDVRKKSLMKKILRKIRPKSKGTGSAIEAAMAAAAAAVDAAIGSSPKKPDDESLSEEKARAIAKTALMVSKEKKKKTPTPNFLQQLVSRTNQIPLTTLPYSDVVTTVDSNGVSLHFPVKEVMMKAKEDSVSDLDASIRNTGKVPVSEIHLNDAEQAHDDASVSTLGTPRVFEQDKLLPTEYDGANQHILGGSAAPPPMVTSHDAKALIDQSDSGTMVGDTTTGTLEDEADPWHTAIGCFPSQQKKLIMEASAHDNIGLQKQNNRNSNRVRARIEEISDDGIETSFEEQPSHDDEDTKSSLTSVFSLAIDNAIRKAEMQIATGNGEKKEEESPLSPILEVDEVVSPTASNTARDAKSPLHIPFAPGIMRTVSASPITSPRSTEVAREAKLSSYLPIAPGVLRSVPVPSDDLPEMHNMTSQHSPQPVSFDKFMNIAASKLHMTTDHSQDQHQNDRYSTEIDDSPRKNISDRTGIKEAGKDETNEATPKIRGDGEKYFFESDNPPHFSDGQFDLLPSTPHNKTQEMIFDLTQMNSKDYGKSQVKFVPLAEMDQGTFLLEKDDAYWDTLSTIASTANDRSSESDEYMDEFVPPGPIPGEITTSNSDVKTEKAAFVTISGQLLPRSPQVAPPPLEQKSGCEENQVPAVALITIHESSQDSAHSGNASAKDTPGGNVSLFNEGSSRPRKKMETAEGFTRSQGNVHDMINDVTDLIDADLLLDQSSASNTKNSNAYNALFETERELVGFNISGNDFHLGNASQESSTSKLKSLMTNQLRPCPEISQDRSRKNVQNKNPSLPIRNVSWGFEEIYEDSNPRLDQSDQETSHSAFSLGDRSRSRSRRGSPQIPKSQPSPEDMRSSTTILQTNDALLTGLDEQDLLSRTLELSKGLLQTIMGRQDIKEHEEQERIETSRSRDARGKLHNDNWNHTRKQFTPPDTRDDFHYQDNRSAISNVIEKLEDDIAPIMIQNRLETLRRQRAQSLAKFRLSQTPVSEERFSYSKFSEPKRRDRDRLKYYTSSHDVGKPTTTSISDRVKNSDHLQSYTDDTDIELKYTTSDSNISVTPSQKARDLRMQLDEAMKASKEIQRSQQKLGSELKTFKSSFKKRYYTRSGEIEDYKRNAIGVER
jgi:hypothetical protein